jgi:DNA polymerase III subunit delta
MISLLYGADELARDEELARRKALISDDFGDMNITLIEGRKITRNALAIACEAVPFLSDRRLVIVDGMLKNLRSEKERDLIQKYLPTVPPTTDLVFVEGEFDKRSAIFNYLKKSGEVREFQPRQGADLQRWLHERARGLGVRLSPDASAMLVDYVGSDSRGLVNELHKLSAYVGEGGTIGVADVQLLVPDDGETSVFAFVDALAARDAGPALQLLHGLLDDGQAALYLLFMVGRQVRILLAVAEYAGQRISPDAIAGEIGQKPFVVRKAVGQAARFDRATLLRLHDRILEFDHWSKTGRIEPEAALDLLVAETCASDHRPPTTDHRPLTTDHRRTTDDQRRWANDDRRPNTGWR